MHEKKPQTPFNRYINEMAGTRSHLGQEKQPSRVFLLLLLSAEKQMAAVVKCSQRRIKPDNVFTPTACRNGSESIAGYQTPQPRSKYSITHLLSGARCNVWSWFDRRALQVSGKSARYQLLRFRFPVVVFFFSFKFQKNILPERSICKQK